MAEWLRRTEEGGRRLRETQEEGREGKERNREAMVTGVGCLRSTSSLPDPCTPECLGLDGRGCGWWFALYSREAESDAASIEFDTTPFHGDNQCACLPSE